MLLRAFSLIDSNGGGMEIGLLARRAIALPPVPASGEASSLAHSEFLERVSTLGYNSVFEVSPHQKITDPVSSVER